MAHQGFDCDDELMGLLNQYRVSMGWTWKRFFLYGIAASIEKNGRNEDLLLKIVETLEGKR
jgi:hypothetical protein